VLEIPFHTECVPWYPQGRLAIDTHQPGRYLQHAAGGYFVQDAGSMLALRLLDPQPHEIIADVCAAPGGKATGILEAVGPGKGFLLANEPIRGRLASLQWTLSRVGYARFATSQYDIDDLAQRLPERFDSVLVDAPCSGQALVGRGKQSIASFDPAQIEHSSARQRRILRSAAALVRPGGKLVYSTCTFAVEENEQVAESLLDAEVGWTVEDVDELREWKSPRDPGGYRIWPHRDRCAGAYAICLRRSGSLTPETNVPSAFQSEAKLPAELRNLVAQAGTLNGFEPIESGRQWYAVPSDSPDWLQAIYFSGSELAYQPSKTWAPAHALSLRREVGWQPNQKIELSDEAAQRYLQGLTLDAHAPGWGVVCWQGNPLGWIHSNASRANNSLPQAARLPYIAPIV
jgi:NOL1/NOP2/fmu family ribosome biogenesis protein